jgi:Predicted ATP-dependent endonuclease of the OLD family
MKIDSIKISGFKGIPVCANFTPENREIPPNVFWRNPVFQIYFPKSSPHISAIIGPNSCGKSSVLQALQYFFGANAKTQDECLFYLKDTGHPIIIEITFRGKVTNPQNWHQTNCANIDGIFFLTLVSIFTTEKRVKLIKDSNGVFKKQATADNDFIESLLPKFRLFPVDSSLSDAVNPEKKNLANEIIDDVISNSSNASNRTIQYKIQKSLTELSQLVQRSNNPDAWKDLEKIEGSISSGLMELGPEKPGVKFNISESIPTLQDIFTKGRFTIDDGVEIGFGGQGLGVQRTFLISLLKSWAEIVGHRKNNQDYFFAIEEPEVFLHPHAIRYLLDVMLEISKEDQVVFTSHNSEFVNSVPLENIIKMCRNGNNRSVIQPNLAQLSQKEKTKVQRYLLEDKSDMLFAKAVLLVEGQTELFALPQFTKKINLELNKKGCSIVFTGSVDNFKVYHQILEAFGIPHNILADGDGNRQSRENKLQRLTNHIHVMDEDFEYLIANKIQEERIIEIVNQCRDYQGLSHVRKLEGIDVTAEQVRSAWWDKISKEINDDIAREHRDQIEEQKENIRAILNTLAETAVQNNYLSPSARTKRLAKRIKDQTKPLAGRAIGYLLTAEEIELLDEVHDALNELIDLAA